MSRFTGKSATIPGDINSIYDRLTNLSTFKQMLDNAPDIHKEKLKGVNVDETGFAFEAPGVGQIKFELNEMIEPTHVSYTASQSIVPMSLSIDLESAAEGGTTLTPSIDIEIPAMLRPMLGKQFQEAADKFGEVFANMVR